jgi:CheY-like chemotaxis protein
MKTVLIIDDNEHERAIFARFLGFVGGKVLEAGNGEEGLRIARRERLNLILLDLSMPVMDGWQTIRQLKGNDRTALVPVVALTAHHLPWKQLRDAGFAGYLEKPIVPVRVLEEVERIAGRLDWRDPRPAEPGPGGESPFPLPLPREIWTRPGEPGRTRVFHEGTGKEWRLWRMVGDSRPGPERRRSDRRRASLPTYQGPERRSGVDRRSAGRSGA